MTELVASGLTLPTTMTFIDNNDILVLEKEKGTVVRIINGRVLEKPVIDLNVSTGNDRGLLGVAFSKSMDGKKYVFLYFTEGRTKDSEDVNEGKEAVTWFDNMSMNPNFTYLYNHSNLPTNWIDPNGNCNQNFKCTFNSTTGQQNIKTALQLSTNITDRTMWSEIQYNQFDVNPGKQYQLVTHMKLNQYATQSHVALQGYNESSKIWYRLSTQCPSGINGPLEWKEFRCNMIIPANITKIIPVLNAGWSTEERKEPLGNRLYRYELENNRLVHPKMLLDLPVTPNELLGGQIQIDPDNNIYILIGDLGHYSKAQNIESGSDTNGTGGILRITQNGGPVGNGILGSSFPLNLYYAYGIRNGFGIDFDPITGNLWDTENGAHLGDEINLVEPGFNSGWRQVQGIWSGDERLYNHTSHLVDSNNLDLVDFEGKGKYSAPELTWYNPVGPTALKFIKSDKLGKQYENDIFVGDFNNGYLYHFDLNGNRNELSLDGPLADKVVNHPAELHANIFGQIFGGISDIEVGPDGYLYVVSIGQGKIFRIVPKSNF
jgi:glucose/arabinose dehydrogenase